VRPRAWVTAALVAAPAAAAVLVALPATAAPGARGEPRASRAARVTLPLPEDTSCDPTASLRPSGPPQVTPGSYMAKIRARGFLIAGVSQSEFHLGYLNPQDNSIEGFDIDAVRAVATAIFGSPDKVEFRALTDPQRITALRSGAVDIVAESMTITCDRLKQIDFSTVYLNDGQQVLVLRNSPVQGISGLSGQKVCANTGSTSITNIKLANPRAIPVAVPYITDCLVKLQQGDVAAVSTDGSVLDGLAAQDPETQIVGARFTIEPHGLGISQQNPDFVRFVNAVLARYRADGQWAASYARWLGSPVPAPPAAEYKA
jgi:polar amino acid transport system substrate-binding protein